MRVPKNDVPVKIDVPGATARQQREFGEADGTMGVEHFSLAAGTDITPLLKGLENDLCQSPHWGYMIDGRVTAVFSDGAEEQTTAGDVFYWPPGHTVRADADAEFVLFSPQHLHTPVLDHLNRQLSS